MASRWLPIILALEIESAGWQANSSVGDTQAYPRDEHCQSSVGSAFSSLRLAAGSRSLDTSSGIAMAHTERYLSAAFTLAKRIRRTVDRLDPQGMPRSYRGVRRTPSAPCAAVLHGLLQSCFITPIRLCDWREEVLLIWMRSRGVIWVLPRAMNDALSRRFAER